MCPASPGTQARRQCWSSTGRRGCRGWAAWCQAATLHALARWSVILWVCGALMADLDPSLSLHVSCPIAGHLQCTAAAPVLDSPALAAPDPKPQCLDLNPWACGADHLWWSGAPGRASHPNKDAPRCLPCNYPEPHDTSKAPFRRATEPPMQAALQSFEQSQWGASSASPAHTLVQMPGDSARV